MGLIRIYKSDLNEQGSSKRQYLWVYGEGIVRQKLVREGDEMLDCFSWSEVQELRRYREEDTGN